MKMPTILLVEDEPIIATDLQFFLEKRGCRVALAADPDEAFSICQKNLPSLVILNFYQKNAPDGMAFARRLRTVFPKIQVFFITGARRLDLEASPDFFPTTQILHKPFTPRQLREAFAYFLP